eukprot:scaffold122_cov236-Pinguiococcus_pyrenoidosus.AAC.12
MERRRASTDPDADEDDGGGAVFGADPFMAGRLEEAQHLSMKKHKIPAAWGRAYLGAGAEDFM